MENKNIAFARVKPDWDNWGLINLKGDYILEPIYKTIYDWRDGIARLEKKATKIDVGGDWTNHLNGEYGFLNSTGELITDFSFGYANDFSEGLGGVNKNKKWGFINKKGELVIPHLYNSILNFHEELCSVEQDKKWGVIDKNGNWAIKNDYEHISFSFGLAIATKKGGLFGKEKKFVINTVGHKIVDLPKDLGWFMPVSEGLILIGTTSNYPGERFYGFMDLKGNIRIKPIFYTNSDSGFDVGRFIDGKLFVKTKEGKSGYVTLQGEFIESDIIENEISENEDFTNNQLFDEVLKFSEGFAVARKGELWGVINEKNEVVIDFTNKKRIWRSKGDKGQYLSGHFPKISCGLLGIEDERDDNIYAGYIDTNGKTIIDFKFRVIEPFINQTAAANNVYNS